MKKSDIDIEQMAKELAALKVEYGNLREQMVEVRMKLNMPTGWSEDQYRINLRNQDPVFPAQLTRK